MRFADIAVYGQPTFDSYLSMFERSDRAYAEAIRAASLFPPEQTVNPPFPQMWAFEPPPRGYKAPGLHGFDPSARDVGSDDRFRLVRTGWVQGALRAEGEQIAQDCIWGRQTAAALDRYKVEIGLPGETWVAQEGHPDWVAITRQLERALALADTGFAPSMCRRSPAPRPPAPPPVPPVTEPETPPLPATSSSSGVGTVLLVGLAAAAGYYAFNAYSRRR
ncbi:MAG: hypothetical protein HC882_00330 [Acidobacteria bacterium]|nr:hypothetical protein [Acidobacteriota bacterium]